MGEDDLVTIPRWALEEIHNLAVSGVMRVPTRNQLRQEAISKAFAVADDAVLSDPAATMKEVVEVLIDLETYFDQRSDVVDGDYGVPEPNAEMQHLTAVQSVLAKLGRG